MKKGFQNKKFLLNQPIKSLAPKVELSVLKSMLERADQEENYELATIIFNRMEQIQKDETQRRS